MYETILYEVRDHIARVTINRPERRNALNPTAYRELMEAFQAIQKDADVRCVVLTGTDPAFCSGEDVKEMLTGDQGDTVFGGAKAVRIPITPTAQAILDCDRPVIAAVNGSAVGWGMELAMFADIRVASDQAKFGELFIKRGLISDIGGLTILPSLVGPEKAAEILFTGDVFDSAEAHRIGLVSHLVPHAELMDRALDIADRIACNPPIALRLMKEGLRRAPYTSRDDMGDFVGHTLARLFKTKDHKEGVQSFLEKRAPVFKGE